MTQAPSELEELRLLREAPLAPGFEERLRERLLVAAKQGTVIQLGRRRRHAWLLLAAIALPVAAFAAGGMSVIGHWIAPEKPLVAPVVTQRAPETQQKARGVSSPPTRPTAAMQELPKQQLAEDKGAGEGGAAAATKGLEFGKALGAPASASRKALSSGSQGVGAFQAVGGVSGVSKVATEPHVAAPSARVEKGPARIESLELTVPVVDQSSKGVVGAGESSKSSALRGATDKSHREQASAEQGAQLRRHNRESVGKQSGQETQERARERNQERLRKGQ